MGKARLITSINAEKIRNSPLNRVGRAARVTGQNFTGTGARRGAKGTGGTFGKLTDGQKLNRQMARAATVTPALGAGLVVGSQAVNPGGYRSKKYERKTAELKKAFNPIKIQRVQRITDIGTKAHTASEKPFTRWPELHKPAAVIAGSAGVGLGALSSHVEVYNKKAKYDRKVKRLNKLNTVQKSLRDPVSVAQGTRVREAPRKAHKDRPRPGKGTYIKAPLLRDKVTKPRWAANALINNPGSAGAIGAVGAAAALQHAKKGMSTKHQSETTVGQGALLGGAGGHVVNNAAWYAGKKQANSAIKSVSHNGQYGPYKDGPHQAEFKKLSRASQKAAKGINARAKAEHFHNNYPAGAPGSGARKAMTFLDKKPSKVGFVAGGAAIGAASAYGAVHNKKVNKMANDPFGISAFGVDHGGSISKAGKYTTNTSKPTDGRLATGAAFPGYHGAIAGKGTGGKVRSAATELGGGLAGSLVGGAVGGALTHGSPAGSIAGSLAGSLGGSMKGTKIAHKKGWLKKQ